MDVQDAQFSSFTIDHINIRGWRSHNAELAGHVRLHGAPHIIAVNESHLDRSVLEPGPEFAGYVRVARLDRRDGRTKGGILAYVRSDVEQRVTFLQHARDLTHERSWFTIHGDIGPVLLCIWYRPPSPGETSSIHGFIDEWRSLRDSCVGTIVVGDLNVHHKHWLKRSVSVSVEGSLLYRFCCDNGFRQLVKEQTHEDGNILDLVLTDLSELERVEILPRISDHNVVRCFANLAVPISAPRSRTVFEFDVANWPAINQHLSSLSWDHISAMPCDDAAVFFTDIVLAVIREHIPEKTVFDNNSAHPWLNERCLRAIREKQSREGRTDYKEFVDKCNAVIWDEFSRYVSRSKKRLAKLPRGSKKWWRFSSALMEKSSGPAGIPALKDESGNWILDSHDKANLFERTFASKCVLPPVVVNEHSHLPAARFELRWCRIRLRWVERELRVLKTDSATGPDGLAALILRKCALSLALPLLLLARRIVATQRWPLLWIQHWVVPIFKRHSVYNPNFYRGVHLTAQASKVIERVLGRLFLPKLRQFAFGADQFAYRPGHGARDAVAIYIMSWLLSLDSGRKVGIYCSDVSGAFDRVSASRLLSKLSTFGLQPELLGVIRSWLRNRSSHVVIAGMRSNGSVLADMVYQGTVWGPSLWNVFVGDVACVVKAHGFSIVIYVDDVNIFKQYPARIVNSRIFEDLRLIQRETHAWGSANQITFDAGKESFAIVSTTNAEGDSFKLLGIPFDVHLRMKECIHETVSEASWRFKSLLRSHRFFNDSEMVGFFKVHVLSYLEYRTPALYHACSTDLLSLDRVLANLLRQIGVSDVEALFEFRLAPLTSRRDMAMLAIIHRALIGEGPPIFRKYFRLQNSSDRRSDRLQRHPRQIVTEFGGNGGAVFKRSIFGLCSVYNLLPLSIVEMPSVHEFQGALQELLKERAAQGQHRWEILFSPRIPYATHPLR